MSDAARPHVSLVASSHGRDSVGQDMTDQVRVLELKVILGILALQQRAPVQEGLHCLLGLRRQREELRCRYVSMRSEERTKYSLIAPSQLRGVGHVQEPLDTIREDRDIRDSIQQVVIHQCIGRFVEVNVILTCTLTRLTSSGPRT